MIHVRVVVDENINAVVVGNMNKVLSKWAYACLWQNFAFSTTTDIEQKQIH